jgi:hypothetical protein
VSGISQRELDEKTIKYVEEQKIDQTKRKLEQEIQKMQDQIKGMIPNKQEESKIHTIQRPQP